MATQLLSDYRSPRSASVRNRNNREVMIVPFETDDISQFRDSLEAATLIYGLEPNFASDAYITSDLTDPDI